AAYLTTAGRALEIEDGATLLAGWDPDATYWPADLLVPAGEPVAWQRADDGRWRPPDPAPYRRSAPPGRQSTSPSGLATRARMNSRSDSRLRYLAVSGLVRSASASSSAHTERSARRATVRATCR